MDLPKPPEALAKKVDMGATYDNDSLRGEVVNNLQKAYSLNMETRMACVPNQL